jgi:glycosyltransferase involved in cell wall biosynthesis
MIKNSVLVVPYKDATQSGVITVANLFKVPVIASNAGGLVEQVTHLKTGLLFETNNIEALKVAMKEVINQTCDFNEIVENAYLETTNLWDCGAKKIIEIA